MRISTIATVLAFATVLSVSAAAQSLATVAQQQEDARQKAAADAKKDSGKGTSAHKVYTNKDLKGSPAPAADPAPAAAPKTAAADAAPDSGKAAATLDKSARGKPEVKDEAWWRKQLQMLHLDLDRDHMLADALQSRVNALTTEFTTKDDPAQQAKIGIERQKALAELDRMQKAATADAKAIADLEEEARRAGVPPGWLR
jgi:hypothetical protein